MAAGLGSRYGGGGTKQVDPVGAHDQAILDYTLYDAWKVGFEKAVFVISSKMAETFPEKMRQKAGGKLELGFAVQRVDDLPDGFALPDGRVKPWGTGHAIRSCRGLLDAPFAVLNADDLYGREAIRTIYGYLVGMKEGQAGQYAMIGYRLGNTLSESGHVARGICEVDDNGSLRKIRERTHIISTVDGPMYTEDKSTYYRVEPDTPVSMNLWGFGADFMETLEREFPVFLKETSESEILSREFLLPNIVGAQLQKGTVTVRVLPCSERWYGVTYSSDKATVVEAVGRMTKEGIYPESLWD